MIDGSSHHFTEARREGFSPVPVDTHTKRPLVAWRRYQSEAADELTCAGWDQASHNIGVVCGAVSGRLMCLDFEGDFMERAIELAPDAHVLLTTWSRGYLEATPSGGRHVLVRLEGSGPLEGNRKLACDPSGHTLVETRGEGGYVIVAPSRNGAAGWELLRGGLESVCYVTSEEWTTVMTALAGLDEAPPAPVSMPLQAPTAPILRLAPSWIEGALAQLPAMAEVLASHGWTQARSHDQYGQHWVRPGKDPREGHSASVSATDRLYVHSSNAGLPMGNPTLDVLDVILCYQLGRRPSSDERTEYLRGVAPPMAGWAEPAGPGVGVGPGSTSLNLPDDFWNGRAYLQATHTAALQRGLSPEGVLGALLSAYATTVPMGIWIPGVVARRAPLNIYSCLVARSGGGKTAAMGVAADLLGWNVNRNPHVRLNRSLRSGEGLPRLVVIPPKKGQSDEPSYHNAVQISFDEGGVLGKQTERSGSTTIPYLNTAWAGSGIVGGAKAGEIVEFPADLVRVCAVLGVQFGAAANLFTGEAAKLGFPQRLLYFGLVNPALASVDPDTMVASDAEPLDLPFWSHQEFVRKPLYLEVPAKVQREVRVWSLNKDHGSGISDPLDGHQMNLQLRIAGLLALMDGRGALDEEDWAMSSTIYNASRAVRTSLITSMDWASQERTKARVLEAVTTADAIDDRWLDKRAQRISRWVAGFTDRGVSLKDIKARLDSTERPRRNEIVEYAMGRGWVIHRDGQYFPGPSQPRTPVGE